MSDLTTLTDVALANESLRAVRDYPANKETVRALDAEMQARGPERMRAAIAEAGRRRESAGRVTLSVSTREAVADAAAYLTGHPDAWRNTHLGHLLRVHAATGAGRTAIIEVRAALGLSETEHGALAEWSRGKSLGDVLQTLAALQAGAQ